MISEGKRRKPDPRLSKLLGVIGVFIVIYTVWSSVFSMPEDILFRANSVAVFLSLTFLLFAPTTKGDKGFSAVDLILVMLSITTAVYIQLNAERIIFRYAFSDPVYAGDVFFGILLTLLVLEACRRVVGYSLPLIGGIFLIYPFVGQYIPGLFGNRGFSLDRVVEVLYITTSGIYGEPVGIAINYALMFMLFGAFLQLSGGSDFFFQLAQRLAGASRGGIGKTAVITSAFFASISGSPIANAASTGQITIPMMIRGGFSPMMAASIETAASAGGPITPPVMGAVAFLMAEIIGARYIDVALAAAIPAILYFIGVFIQVDSEAVRNQLKGIPRDQLPPVRNLVIGFIQFIGPVIWMVYRLFLSYSPSRVALETIVILMVITLIRRRGRITLQEVIDACYGSVRSNLMVVIAAAAGGMIVGIISLTGIGSKFTALILSMSGGFLLPALLLTAVVTILLGFAMNITPSYILIAALAGPALVKAGIPPMAAHLFMVYYAATASISPPVAMTAFTAATIAGANPMAVGWRGFRMAIVAYLVPFAFVYRPELLGIDNFGAMIKAVVMTSLALYAFVAGMDGILLGGRLILRVVLMIDFVLLLIPQYSYNTVGVIILALIIILSRWNRPQLKVRKAEHRPSGI